MGGAGGSWPGGRSAAGPPRPTSPAGSAATNAASGLAGDRLTLRRAPQDRIRAAGGHRSLPPGTPGPARSCDRRDDRPQRDPAIATHSTAFASFTPTSPTEKENRTMRHITHRRTATAATGLALAALAATIPAAVAGGTAHIQQVALSSTAPASSSSPRARPAAPDRRRRTTAGSSSSPQRRPLVAPGRQQKGSPTSTCATSTRAPPSWSARSAGVPGNDISHEPTISADGRYVAFTTWADNLTELGHQRARARRRRQGPWSNEDESSRPARCRTAEFQRDRTASRRCLRRRPVGGLPDLRVLFSQHATTTTVRTSTCVTLDNGKTRQGSLLPGTNRDVRGGGPGRRPVRRRLGRDVRQQHQPVGPQRRRPVRRSGSGRSRTRRRARSAPDGGSAGRPAISGDGRFAAFASCALDLPREDGPAHTDVYRINLTSGKIIRVHPEGQRQQLPAEPVLHRALRRASAPRPPNSS